MLELALASLVRELTELTEHAVQSGEDWRHLLLSDDVRLAELERLRSLAERPIVGWPGCWHDSRRCTPATAWRVARAARPRG